MSRFRGSGLREVSRFRDSGLSQGSQGFGIPDYVRFRDSGSEGFRMGDYVRPFAEWMKSALSGLSICFDTVRYLVQGRSILGYMEKGIQNSHGARPVNRDT